MGVEQRLPGGHDRRSARAQAGHELRLGRGDRLDRPHELEMDGRDGGDEADVGLGDRGELGDLTRSAHAHLEHERLGPGGRLEHRHGQPDLGVEVLAVRDRAQALGEHRGQDVLRRGLAHRAGDPDHGAAQGAPPPGGEALQGGQGILRRDDRSGLRATCSVGVRGRDEHPPRAAGQRLRRKAPAVDVLADEPDEQIAGSGGARVDHGARRATGVRCGRHEPPAGGPRDLLRRPLVHAAPHGPP